MKGAFPAVQAALSWTSTASTATLVSVIAKLIRDNDQTAGSMSTDNSSLTVTKRAPPPFDKRPGSAPICTADVVLRTSDGVDFYVHKVVLALASPFFAGLFSISQPSSGQTIDDLPVIDVDEDTFTLDCLLRYCYPVQDPTLTDLNSVDRVLGAVTKYALEEAEALVTQHLQGYLEAQSLQVFAVSCHHGCEKMARIAAQVWKRTQGQWTYVADRFCDTAGALCYATDLARLRASVHYRLVKYVVTDELPANFSAPLFNPPINAPVDLQSYPFDQPTADIVLQSIDGILFPVNRAIVEIQILSNPIYPLQTMLFPGRTGILPDKTDDGRPLFSTRETGAVLSRLLCLCYPPRFGDPACQITDANCCSRQMASTIAAALQYGMHAIVDTYKNHLRRAIPRDAFAVYSISLMFGWHSDARDAAIFMAKHVMLPRIKSVWMDVINTKQFYTLLQFWHQCQDAIFATVRSSVPGTEATGVRWKEDWYRCPVQDGQRARSVLTPLVEQELWKMSSTVRADPGCDLALLCKESHGLEDKINERLTAVRPACSLPSMIINS